MGAITLFNRVMTAAFDVPSRPLQAFPPIWALALLSLVSGIAMVWVFGRVSDQQAIRLIRSRVRGNLIGVRLYRHDVGVVMALQGRIFSDTGRYLAKSLAPIVVMMVPVVLIMAQLNLRFAVRPFVVGETVLVQAHVRDAGQLDSQIDLETSPGLQVETPPVRIASLREIAWRLRVTEAGRQTVAIHMGDDRVEMTVMAGGRWSSVPQRSSGTLSAILNPGSAMPAGGPLDSIAVAYPALQIAAFGLSMSWVAWFFVLSMGFGFLFKGPLGVDL